ncbi:MAG: hypothetical protein ACREEV_06720 [Dongiaceae bacterium]
MDTLTAIVLVVMFLVLVAPIVEIAVKRPKILLEMTHDTRAFAEAPLRESAAVRSSAALRDVALPDDNRLAGLTS